eukprot:385796-Pyramimonas_sp.AAC.1
MGAHATPSSSAPDGDVAPLPCAFWTRTGRRQPCEGDLPGQRTCAALFFVYCMSRDLYDLVSS